MDSETIISWMCQVRVVLQELQELQVHRELQGISVIWELQELKELQELQDHKDHQVNQLDHPDLLETQVFIEVTIVYCGEEAQQPQRNRTKHLIEIMGTSPAQTRFLFKMLMTC